MTDSQAEKLTAQVIAAIERATAAKTQGDHALSWLLVALLVLGIGGDWGRWFDGVEARADTRQLIEDQTATQKEQRDANERLARAQRDRIEHKVDRTLQLVTAWVGEANAPPFEGPPVALLPLGFSVVPVPRPGSIVAIPRPENTPEVPTPDAPQPGPTTGHTDPE